MYLYTGSDALASSFCGANIAFPAGLVCARAYLASEQGGGSAYRCRAIAATISARLVPQQQAAASAGYALNTKKRWQKSTWSGRVLLHQRFVELSEIGSK